MAGVGAALRGFGKALKNITKEASCIFLNHFITFNYNYNL